MACSSSLSSENSSTTLIPLTENDIPGASLQGRIPEQLKNEELRFWLKCRGDPCKGLKTKAQLVKRVHEYIQNGKDKAVVDPDPNKIYSRRKEVQGPAGIHDDGSKIAPVKFPSDNWGTSLEKMPMFSKANLDRHVINSGKNIANKDHNYLPTALKKAKTFLEDE